MKFKKGKTDTNNNELSEKDVLRKKIWKNPSIIIKLFSDKEWEKFDNHQPSNTIPSADMLNHIHTTIKNIELEKEQKIIRKQNLHKIWLYSGAAAAIIMLFISFSLWQWQTPINSEIAKTQQKPKTSILADTTWAIVSNHTNHIKTLRLPDKSTVALFANSTIRYPEKFSSNAREIHLNGKAYFSVKKDASRPFSVFAKGTKTTALGTSFTIDTRSTHKTNVKLHTGKIVIASINSTPSFKKAYLDDAGESLSFDTRSNKIERTRIIAKQLIEPTKTAKTKLLDMNNMPLTEVFNHLAEAYHKKLIIGSDNIAHIQYTGSIDIENESLNDALAVICLINDLRYVIATDGSYTIYTQQQNSTNKK